MTFCKGLFTIILLFLFASSAGAGPAETEENEIRDALKNMVEAYGGRDNLERVKALSSEGTIIAFMLNDSGTYSRQFQRDRKLRVETDYKRSFEHRILNGKKGWRGTNINPMSPVKDHRYMAMVYQYKQIDLPFALMEGRYVVEYRGKDISNGIEALVLNLVDDEGPPMKVWISLKDYTIVKSAGFFEIADRPADLTAEFSDFKKVDGVLFPFVITNFGSGQKIGKTVIRIHKVNPDIDQKLFEPELR